MESANILLKARSMELQFLSATDYVIQDRLLWNTISLGHISNRFQPYYQTREFTSVIFVVYSLPFCQHCMWGHWFSWCKKETQHPSTFIVTSGGFIQPCLSPMLSTFQKFAFCTSIRDAYSSSARPAFNKGEHNLVFLSSTNKSTFHRKNVTNRTVRRGSQEAEKLCGGVFEATDSL